jgi:5-methylcytosine-specific restriction endonuclease McrBC regulatory subunit McrC
VEKIGKIFAYHVLQDYIHDNSVVIEDVDYLEADEEKLFQLLLDVFNEAANVAYKKGFVEGYKTGKEDQNENIGGK